MERNSKIAVVGGGLCGLLIAEGLVRKGYENISLLEKNNRLGGKLYSIDYGGKSYELGAVFGLPSHFNLIELMERLNIKAHGPRLSRTNYNSQGKKVMSIPKEDLGKFMEELERLPKVLSKYKSLENPNIVALEAPLMKTFSLWCKLNDFQVLKTVFTQYFTSFGLGYIEEVPAIYVLKTIGYRDLMSFMDVPDLYTWKEGVSILVHSLASKIKNIRLGQEVKDIGKSPGGKLYIQTAYEEIEFHKIIITAPLDKFSHLHIWDREMKENLESIKYQSFSVYTFIVENMPKGCGCMLDNLNLSREGHLSLWNTRWDDLKARGLLTVYSYDQGKDYKKDSLKYIKEDLKKVGVEKPSLYRVKHWRHAPYLDPKVLEKGFYEKIESIQGRKNIFLAGEILSGVSMENSIRYSKYFLGKYF